MIPSPVQADFDVPVTFRNWNFAKSAVAFGVLAAALLWLNVVSSWRLEWLGIGLFALSAAAMVFFTASWSFATLKAEFDYVRVGGLAKRIHLGWDEIELFSIMEPEDRTPFMLGFWRWRDQKRPEIYITLGGSSNRCWLVRRTLAG